MADDRDRFGPLAGDAIELRKGTNAHAIVSFLAKHPDEAFTRDEIVTGANIPEDSVGPVLRRLADDALVEERGRSWTLAADDLEP